MGSEMNNSSPLAVAFFDVGGTLGAVTEIEGVRRLSAYASSVLLLTTMKIVLGLRIGIISNIPDDMTTGDLKAMLAEAGLLTFVDEDLVVSSRDANSAKPHPEIYRFVAVRAGVATPRCLYVGDDEKEVAGARSAGMAAILKPGP